MEKDIFQKIIEAANMAPSGGNSQPWKFAVKNQKLIITTLPEKDHPVFNYRGRGTLIALGAVLENISIAAIVYGYQVEFVHSFSPHAVTSVTFIAQKKDGNAIKLYNAISDRHSNRTLYRDRSLTEEESAYIFEESKRFSGARVILLDKKKDRVIAAQQLAHDAPINFGNKKLHKLAYKELIWTREEEAEKGGLYFRTLEIDQKQEKPVRLMRKWLIATIFRRLGLFKRMYKTNVARGSSGSIIGLIGVPNSDESFINAGRTLQNIWLRATCRGLSLHILAGMVFLWQYENLGTNRILSFKDREIVNEAYENLRELAFIGKDELISITFRMGEGSEPMAVSHKRQPEVEWEN